MRIALIPAYEPDRDLMIETLCDLRQARIEILVVNNGSSPNYEVAFEQAS